VIELLPVDDVIGRQLVLVAAMLALMYQGERWMLERPGAAPDPSLIATCALNAVGDLPPPTCVSELIP